MTPQHPRAASKGSSQQPRYGSLDMWRGVACLMVVAYHVVVQRQDGDSWPALIGVLAEFHLGVPIFFVISGYCIAAAADASLRRGDTVRQYAVRRLRRILPPYWIAVAGSALLALLLGRVFPELREPGKSNLRGLLIIAHPGTVTSWSWIGNATLSEGWRTHLVWRGGGNWILPTAWTLGFEEQFYAVVGVLVVVARSQWQVLAAGVTVGVLILATAVHPSSLQGFFFDGHWIQFAVGIGVYLSANRTDVRWRFLSLLLFAAGACWSVVEFARYRTLLAGSLVSLIFGLGLVLLRPFDALLESSRIVRPLFWCGKRCYSIYLVHYPVALWVGATAARFSRSTSFLIGVVLPAVLVLTLLVSHIFFEWCEEPFLNTPSRRDVGVRGVPADQSVIQGT